MTTLDLARKAALIAKRFHSPVRIKHDGYAYCICIGWTDKDDDRAWNAICKELGYNHGLELCADVSGHGVKTLETF